MGLFSERAVLKKDGDLTELYSNTEENMVAIHTLDSLREFLLLQGV